MTRPIVSSASLGVASFGKYFGHSSSASVRMRACSTSFSASARACSASAVSPDWISNANFGA